MFHHMKVLNRTKKQYPKVLNKEFNIKTYAYIYLWIFWIIDLYLKKILYWYQSTFFGNKWKRISNQKITNALLPSVYSNWKELLIQTLVEESTPLKFNKRWKQKIDLTKMPTKFKLTNNWEYDIGPPKKEIKYEED